MVSEYANLQQIPMILSAVFLAAGLYQFGAIEPITVNWFGGYTLDPQHAMVGSLGSFLVAFMSSETRQFENYATGEMILIALGPLVIAGDYLTVEVSDFLVSLGDPLGMQLAFLATAVSWTVAVR